MLPSLIVLIAVALASIAWFVRGRLARRREILAHSIGPEELHQLLSSGAEPTVLDVRLPLDLLAYSEVIQGARRIAPQDIIENPDLIPKDGDYVLYCTCPGDESSLKVLHRALCMGFARVKVLKGGLAGWKAKGYPVEPFSNSFHLERH